MALSFQYLSWETIYVFAALGEHVEAVMAIENSSIGPDLQRAIAAWHKGGLQLGCGEAAKQVELDLVQSAFRMQKVWGRSFIAANQRQPSASNVSNTDGYT
jgi:hypothetical protein